MIAYIWAQDETGVIGKQGTLPWHLPADLQHFKKTTLSNAVVMGRKTFDSLKNKPLPNRLNVVMTRSLDYSQEVAVVHSKEDVLALEQEYDGTIFIIGGRDIFELFLDEVDVLYRTVLHATFEGDVYFPELDYTTWNCIERNDGILDEKNTIPHTYETWIKKA